MIVTAILIAGVFIIIKKTPKKTAHWSVMLYGLMVVVCFVMFLCFTSKDIHADAHFVTKVIDSQYNETSIFIEESTNRYFVFTHDHFDIFEWKKRAYLPDSFDPTEYMEAKDSILSMVSEAKEGK